MMPATADMRGQTCQRFIGCAFGQQIDRPADSTPTGIGTRQKGRGTTHHFDPFKQFGSDILTWQQTEKTIERNVV